MKLSEELIWRGFLAQTTLQDPSELDQRKRKFYFGADPSADSLTIGNLAALLMCACFVRHGYTPILLVGGATGQIGDPKENGERDLKPLAEVEHNKQIISAQMHQVLQSPDLIMVDNYDWFKDINYIDFLREVGKAFSMTQLLDRQFIQNRIGEGGSGISYAEFSYTLIQGYDFLHLYREYGVDLQLCGADQFGNSTSGIHLIKRLEGGTADVWATPLIIDPVTGRKFGKSEGNAIWLSKEKTSIFDFYQFWLGQSDLAVETMLKIYTLYDRFTIEQILSQHQADPAQRLAQQQLALGVTTVVHGAAAAAAVAQLSAALFAPAPNYHEIAVSAEVSEFLPKVKLGTSLTEALVITNLAPSKTAARQLISAGAVTVNGKKVLSLDYMIEQPAIIKKGKNSFALACSLEA